MCVCVCVYLYFFFIHFNELIDDNLDCLFLTETWLCTDAPENEANNTIS